MDGGDKSGRERKERLRARRDAAGMAQVSGWVPKERRAYAREVIAALARGVNSLPPDPEQMAALEAARVEAEAARAAQAKAEQHGQVMAAELDAAFAESETRRQAEAAALVRADAAEQGREAAARELAAVRAEAGAAQEATKVLREELEGIRNRRGWRGALLRFAGV